MRTLATTAEVLKAIADPRRRELIETLGRSGDRAHPVGELVRAVRLPQPAVSKHLGVLRRAGIVTVSKAGQHRLYRLNREGLKPVQEWIAEYERFWDHNLSSIKARAEAKARESGRMGTSGMGTGEPA